MADSTNQTILSQNQGDASSLPAAMDFMQRQKDLFTDGLMPCQVLAFDRAANIVTVKPMIQWVKVDGSLHSRDELVNVPALSLGGGKFHISFPIEAGDLGWIWAGDREMAAFRKTLAEAPPAHGRTKSFADGLFIPDVFYKYTINGEDTNAMVIQSTDGATRISIRGDNIKITAPSKVVVDTPESEFTGNVTIDKNLLVKQTATITQKTTANGGFESKTGTACTLPANTTVGAINVSTHGHTQQNNGSGRTAGGMTT